ncbi:MAG: VWA domain-containing protein [Candidatus Binatia bacterium]
METRRIGCVLCTVVLLCVAHAASGQRSTPASPAEPGWQGQRPQAQSPTLNSAPQTPLLVPLPQTGNPTGTQVLEIPRHEQPTISEPERQQQVSIPPMQPDARPSQLLTVTVTDRDGHYVADLKSEDFIVYEEELPRPLTYFNRGQNEPVSLGLVVDMSESMTNKLRQARQAVRRLADTIQTQDEVFLLAFSQQPVVVQDFTDSRALVLQATAQLRPNGGTALYDAVLDGLHRMQSARHQKKALVVITDGLDTASRASLQEVNDAVRTADILVYTIGIGNPNDPPLRAHRGLGPSPFIGAPGAFPRMGRGPFITPPSRVVDEAVDSRLLSNLSAQTGAKHFLLNTAEVLGHGAVLEQAADTIVSELRQQYSLGYRSVLKGDVRRDVRVEIRRPDLSVRTQPSVGSSAVTD